jgi:hypothetical protein
MASTTTVTSTNIVDTAVGAMTVTFATVQNADIDDYVTSQVVSLATTLQMYNKLQVSNTTFTQNRRIVSIGGVTVGGY